MVGSGSDEDDSVGIAVRRTSGWELEPFADGSAAFVFATEPPGISVLDRLTWYVLELCDGSPITQIEDRVAGVAQGLRDARTVARARLRTLEERGLVTIGEGAA